MNEGQMFKKAKLSMSDIKETCTFSTDFRKNIQISNVMKIRTVGAGLFHANRRMDGRTDMTKLTVSARKFVKAPKNASKNLTNCEERPKTIQGSVRI